MPGDDAFSTSSFRSGASAGRPWPADRWRAALAAVSALLGAWLQRHRTRRALDALDDHMLRDIGLTRLDAARERSKRFWQP